MTYHSMKDPRLTSNCPRLEIRDMSALYNCAKTRRSIRNAAKGEAKNIARLATSRGVPLRRRGTEPVTRAWIFFVGARRCSGLMGPKCA